MSTARALGACWAALLLARAWRTRPVRSGRRLPGGLDLADPAPGPRRRSPATLAGAALLALAERVGGPVAAPLAAVDPARLGRTALAAVATVLVVAPLGTPAAVPAGLAVAALVWGAPGVGERRRRRRATTVVRQDLPQTVDLLALAVGAGLTVPLALAAVVRHASGPVPDALGRVLQTAGAGLPLAEALGALPDRLGDDVRPLVSALTSSLRHGAALGDGLDRLAGELRTTQRRRAEEAARRVPVALLFPLVCCILPAFALLTVAPLLAGALGSLRA